MSLDEKVIAQVVEQVVQKLMEQQKEAGDSDKQAPKKGPDIRDGVFQDMESAIKAALEAQKQLVALPLSVREKLIQAIRDTGLANAGKYALQEFEETGLGSAEDNVKKIESSCRVLGMEDLAPEVYAGDKGLTVMERIPIGVIASVNPVTNGVPSILFNGIMMLSGGNTVINNPHPKTKGSSAGAIRELNEAIVRAGGPANCICCLEEPSVPSAQKLMTHPDVGLIAVTGGHGVVAFASKTGKRVIAQGGAANFMVVMPDCNIRGTVAALMTSFFGNAGQRCLAGQSLIIVGEDDAFYKTFVDTVVETTAKIRIGYGLDESVQMGPLRDKAKKENVLRYIESGLAEGAKLLLDGRTDFKIVGDYPDTCFLGPTIMESCCPDMKVVTEEIFGPTMGIIRVKTLDEAIDICNASPFANGDAIFTSSGKTARDFQYRVVSGNVGINVGIAAPMAFFPFSGMKDSFLGVLHTQGQEAVRFFTESKVVIQRWF